MIIENYEDESSNKKGYIIDSVNCKDDFPIQIYSDYKNGLSYDRALDAFLATMKVYFEEAWDKAFKTSHK